MCHQSSTDDHLLNKSSGYFRVKRSKISWHLTSNLLSESKQKQNKLSECTFLRRRDQSASDINIPLHPFSHTRLPTNEICTWLPCYRFQRGPNLPLENRQLPVSPVFPSSLLLTCSPAPAPTLLHISDHAFQHHARGTLLSAGCRVGGPQGILQSKVLNRVSEVIRND